MKLRQIGLAAALVLGFGAAYHAADARAIEDMRVAGYTSHSATPEQVAEMRERMKPIEDVWMARAKAAGLEDPAAILARFRAETSAAEK